MSDLPQATDPELIQLAASLELTPGVVTQRLHVLGLAAADRARLREVGPAVRAVAPKFFDAFYERLLQCPATRSWISSTELVDRLKRSQAAYLDDLFESELDFDHALRCLKIGITHHRARLTPQWFVASYGHILFDFWPVILDHAGSIHDGLDLLVTLLKTALFDVSLVLDGYAMSAGQTLRSQSVVSHTQKHSTLVTSTPHAAGSAPPAVSRIPIVCDDAAERADFLGIDENVLTELRSLGKTAERALPRMLEEFYDLFSTWDETQSLVPPALVERLKREVSSYWVELFRGELDRSYVASRTLIGIVHERVGLTSPRYVIGLAQQVSSLLQRAVPESGAPKAAADALLRAVFFDLSFVLQAYVDARAAAVLRSDGFASELLAGLTAGVAIVDEQMRVDAVNPALLALFGLRPGLVRFVQLSEVLPIPEAVELVRGAWAKPTTRVSRVIERENRAFRATALQLSTAGHPTVALVLDEITDIVRVQSEAQHTETTLSHALDSVGAFVWEADMATMTPSLVSRASLEVTGFRDVALLARPDGLLSLIPEPDRMAFRARCVALRAGDPCEIRHRLIKADASTVWLRTQVARAQRHDGSAWLSGVSIDATSEHLEEQRRLEAVGRLAGGIAHEYNNRLTVILTSLSLVGYADIDPSAAELLHEAKVAADRCTALTREILSFAQRQVLRPQPVALNELVDAARPMLARILGESVQLELRLAPDLWSCRIDAKELESALLSVVTNSRDSMPAGGRVTLSTRNVPASAPRPSQSVSGEPVAADTALQDLVEIAIEDNGMGMDDSVRQRAFEPFFSTKPDARGLGLSIVHGFVAQSGGKVALASKSGNGTVVRLMFPRMPDRSEPTADTKSDGQPFVLAVDDEPSLRLVLKSLLQRLGYAVATAATITEALAILRERKVDVLLTDVVLAGGESGATLAPQARDIQPDLSVIYISGFARDSLDLESLGERDWFVSKPFTMADMRAVLREALTPISTQRGA